MFIEAKIIFYSEHLFKKETLFEQMNPGGIYLAVMTIYYPDLIIIINKKIKKKNISNEKEFIFISLQVIFCVEQCMWQKENLESWTSKAFIKLGQC